MKIRSYKADVAELDSIRISARRVQIREENLFLLYYFLFT
jgi:hypothetical protein